MLGNRSSRYTVSVHTRVVQCSCPVFSVLCSFQSKIEFSIIGNIAINVMESLIWKFKFVLPTQGLVCGHGVIIMIQMFYPKLGDEKLKEGKQNVGHVLGGRQFR